MRNLETNGFIVVIQGILDRAEEIGWKISFIEKTAHEAIDEWMEEKEKEQRKRK